MINYNQYFDCVECKTKIDSVVFNYSTQNFRQPLCKNCQEWFKDILNYSSATNEAIALYFSLRKRGVPAILEKHDGYKTIDIAVPEAKVNIEVDGAQHSFNAQQALSDLKRTYYSFIKGYLTLRIPNSLAKSHLEHTADIITEFLIESRDNYQHRIDRNDIQVQTTQKGFCIRCSHKLNFNPNKPFCLDCFSTWAQYENYTYEENFCHCCGGKTTTSMSKPTCLDCYITL